MPSLIIILITSLNIINTSTFAMDSPSTDINWHGTFFHVNTDGTPNPLWESLKKPKKVKKGERPPNTPIKSVRLFCKKKRLEPPKMEKNKGKDPRVLVLPLPIDAFNPLLFE